MPEVARRLKPGEMYSVMTFVQIASVAGGAPAAAAPAVDAESSTVTAPVTAPARRAGTALMWSMCMALRAPRKVV